jgi:cell division ATPase FtsA
MSKALTLILSLSGKEVSAQFADQIIRESVMVDGVAPGINHIGATLKKVCELIEKQAAGHIQTVHVFFSAPWSLSQSRNIKINEEKGFILNDKILAKLIHDERAAFEEYAKKENLIRGEEKLLEAKIMDITANGYPVGTTIPKTLVNSLNVAVFMSVGNASLMKKVTELTEKHFHTHRIMFHTAPIALYSAVIENQPNILNFTIVHLSDEATEVIIVKKRSIQESLVLPFGKNGFIKDIAKTLGSSIPLAASFLRMHSNEKLDELTSKKIVESIEKSTTKWRTFLCDALGKVSNETFVPHEVALFVDPVLSQPVKKSIESDECSVQIVNTDGFTVQVYDERILSEASFINKLEVLSE